MWKNIGIRLQMLARILCWLGIIGSVIYAIVLWSQNSSYQPTILPGILYLVLGSLASWIGSWTMYGLGLVVEHVENQRVPSHDVQEEYQESNNDNHEWLSSFSWKKLKESTPSARKDNQDE